MSSERSLHDNKINLTLGVTKYQTLIDISIIFFSLTIFYFLWLGQYPLFTPDEGRYSEVAREMLASKDFITPTLNGIPFLDKPILHYWLQALAMQLFGVNEWSIRFFPALFGIIGCVLTYSFGKLFFNRRVAMLATFILAMSPLYFGGAHYANLDLEVAIFMTGSLFCFMAANRRASISNPSLYLFAASIFAALAVLTKGLIGIALPVMIIGIWLFTISARPRLSKTTLCLAFILFFSISFPWFFLVQKANPNFFNYFFLTEHFKRFLSLAYFNNQLPIWFYLPVLAIGFFPWIIFLPPALFTVAKRVYVNREQHTLEWFLLLWVVLILGFFSIPKAKLVTYILPVFPPLALLLGIYLDKIWNEVSKTRPYSCFFILAAVGFASFLVFFKQQQRLDFQPGLLLYVNMILITVLISAFCAYQLRQRTLRALVGLFILDNVVILMILVLSASSLNTNSTKLLVNFLKPSLKSSDLTISYNKFYQDIPLYLNQEIIIVSDTSARSDRDDWIRELTQGIDRRPQSKLILKENLFWLKWLSKQRVFVFLHRNDLPKFQNRTKGFKILKTQNQTLLITNQV